MNPLRLAILLTVITVLAVARAAWGEVLVRISQPEHVLDAKEISGAVWIATESGVSRIDDNSTTDILRGALSTTIAEVHGEIWIGTQNGIIQLNDTASPKRASNTERLFINSILTNHNATWLGARQGLFRITDTKPETVHPVLAGSAGDHAAEPLREVLVLRIIRGVLWVGARGNAYRIDERGFIDAVLESPVSGSIADIVEINDSIWLTTLTESGLYGPSFRIAHDGQIQKIEGVISSVASVRGEVWLATNNGAFRYHENGNSEGPIGGLSEPTNVIKEIGGLIWVGTTRCLYRSLEGRVFSPFPEENRLNVKEIKIVSNDIWFLSTGGIYRLDKSVGIRVILTTLGPLSLQETIGIQSIRYNYDGHSPYGGAIEGRFQAILHSSERAFREAQNDKRYASYQGIRMRTRSGLTKIYLQARDAFGNTYILSRNIIVIPGYTSFLILIYVLFVGLFMLAPWSDSAMSIMMMPILRRYGSGFIIPLLLTSRACRQYLLQRYRWAILKDDDFGEYSYLLRPSLDRVLAGRNQYIVTGRAKEVTFALKGLVRRQAVGEISSFGRRIPVYLSFPLDRRPENIYHQLATNLSIDGGVTDLELGANLVQRGEDYVFVFDNLTAASHAERLALKSFLDSQASTSILIIGIPDLPAEYPHDFPYLKEFTKILAEELLAIEYRGKEQ